MSNLTVNVVHHNVLIQIRLCVRSFVKLHFELLSLVPYNTSYFLENIYIYNKLVAFFIFFDSVVMNLDVLYQNSDLSRHGTAAASILLTTPAYFTL
jgi:hypothetical protein